ncbi:MAG: hypothetical protein GY859_15020 [Desulfobacterales bacterium]|nr:hypothetical protein [Desulfobacterales bacterium]
MKPEQIYEELKDLTERLDITFSEQNFRTTGIHVKSGLCRVKGKNRFIMDKHKSLDDKIQILAACLGRMNTENIYVVPAVREVLDRRKPADADTEADVDADVEVDVEVDAEADAEKSEAGKPGERGEGAKEGK